MCAAKRQPANNRAAAQFDFGETKGCLKDCGITDTGQTTYQMGKELLEKLAF